MDTGSHPSAVARTPQLRGVKRRGAFPFVRKVKKLFGLDRRGGGGGRQSQRLHAEELFPTKATIRGTSTATVSERISDSKQVQTRQAGQLPGDDPGAAAGRATAMRFPIRLELRGHMDSGDAGQADAPVLPVSVVRYGRARSFADENEMESVTSSPRAMAAMGHELRAANRGDHGLWNERHGLNESDGFMGSGGSEGDDETSSVGTSFSVRTTTSSEMMRARRPPHLMDVGRARCSFRYRWRRGDRSEHPQTDVVVCSPIHARAVAHPVVENDGDDDDSNDDGGHKHGDTGTQEQDSCDEEEMEEEDHSTGGGHAMAVLISQDGADREEKHMCGELDHFTAQVTDYPVPVGVHDTSSLASVYSGVAQLDVTAEPTGGKAHLSEQGIPDEVSASATSGENSQSLCGTDDHASQGFVEELVALAVAPVCEGILPLSLPPISEGEEPLSGEFGMGSDNSISTDQHIFHDHLQTNADEAQNVASATEITTPDEVCAELKGESDGKSGGDTPKVNNLSVEPVVNLVTTDYEAMVIADAPEVERADRPDAGIKSLAEPERIEFVVVRSPTDEMGTEIAHVVPTAGNNNRVFYRRLLNVAALSCLAIVFCSLWHEYQFTLVRGEMKKQPQAGENLGGRVASLVTPYFWSKVSAKLSPCATNEAVWKDHGGNNDSTARNNALEIVLLMQTAEERAAAECAMAKVELEVTGWTNEGGLNETEWMLKDLARTCNN